MGKSLPIAKLHRFQQRAGGNVDNAGQGEAHAGNGGGLEAGRLDDLEHCCADLLGGGLRPGGKFRRRGKPGKGTAQVVDQADVDVAVPDSNADGEGRFGVGEGEEFACRAHGGLKSNLQKPPVYGVLAVGARRSRAIITTS